MIRTIFVAALSALTALFFVPQSAAAQTQPALQDVRPDRPDPLGTGLRDAATPIAEEIHVFYDGVLLPMKLGISFFVLALLIWVVIRYNKRANPQAQKFSHNTPLEVMWTVVPIFILVIIGFPSFNLLYLEDKMPDGQVHEYDKVAGQTRYGFTNDFPERRQVAKSRHIEVAAVADDGTRRLLEYKRDFDIAGLGDEQVEVTLKQALSADERLVITAGRTRVGAKPLLGMFGEDRSEIIPAPTLTIKATGYQWGWAYSYPDFGDFEFDALLLPEAEAAPELYRLATTNDIVVPAGETVRVITTARDVIHSWAMPAFGIKIDAIPGRLNETWFRTDQLNTFYGQCSEICGKDHAFMPISVRVVPRGEFEAWVDEQRELNGLEPMFSNQELAAADTGAGRQAALTD